jgi:hypothetical protein
MMMETKLLLFWMLTHCCATHRCLQEPQQQQSHPYWPHHKDFTMPTPTPKKKK